MDALAVITAIKDVVLTVAGVTTTTVAVKGLNSWRQEHRGKVEYEAARALIRAAYKVRDAYESATQSIVSKQLADNNPYGDPQSPLQQQTIVDARWNEVANAQLEFDAHALEAEALWGTYVVNLADALRALSLQRGNSKEIRGNIQGKIREIEELVKPHLNRK